MCFAFLLLHNPCRPSRSGPEPSWPRPEESGAGSDRVGDVSALSFLFLGYSHCLKTLLSPPSVVLPLTVDWKIGQRVHRERGLHHLRVQRTRERNLPLNEQFLLPALRQKGGLG